jgi:ParB/RepB/Spo0J family partition protein
MSAVLERNTAAATALRIPLAAIAASKTNPRKRFDEAKLAELTESIRRLDVLQPILVRPVEHSAGSYELVAGERRFRAAVAAGLADIPATIRVLTDAEVLEVQVVENLQREDVHELEEAEGYERLLRCTHANGERYTVDEIAAKVGKSRSYVFARLKLCSLCPEARKAFYAGEIDASKALLIARIGHHDTQRQALKDVTGGRWGNGQAMSYRDAHQHILQTYMLQLKSAPFDITDAKLLAKAGACGPCQKRTGNQADLFGDVKSADVCTDPKCFDDKRAAHYAVAARQLEEQGFKVVTGDAAKKALPGWEHWRQGSYLQIANGYEKWDATTYVAGRGRPVKSLFADDYKPTKLQHPLTGEIFEVVTQQAIAAAAKKLPEPKKSKSGGAARQQREPERKPEEIFRERLFAEILKKLPREAGKAELRLLAKDLIQGSDGGEEIIADFLVPLKDGKKHDVSSAMKAMKDGADKMPADELLRLCVAVAIGRHCEPYSYKPVELLETAKLYKVDPAKVKKAIADEAKAAATKEAEATPAKKKGLGRGMPVVKEPKKGLAALGIESPGAKKLKAKK